MKDHEARLKNHLLPFFGGKGLSEVTAGLLQEYRVMRLLPNEETGKTLPAARCITKPSPRAR